MITYFYKLLLLATVAVSVSVYEQSNAAKYAPNHENYEPVEYAFSYEVADPLTGDQKHHWEKRHGDQVQGEYGLMEPDGYARIVQYTANSQDGFQAIVKRIQVPAKDHTQGKPLYAENEQLYDNIRYGVTITHNVPSKQNELNTPTVQQRVDTNIVQRDINNQPKKIVRKNDQNFFVDDRIIATTFRPQYNVLQPKIGQYLIQNQRNLQPQQEKLVVSNHQTSQILPYLDLYTPNPNHNLQHISGLRPQILQNQKEIQYNFNQQPLQLPIQLHGYQHNIQNNPVQASQNVHYQSALNKNPPIQYQNQAYQHETEQIVQLEMQPQQTGPSESDMSRVNNDNVGYHEVEVQNEKIPTQVYKNYGYQNEELNKPESQQHENIELKEYNQVSSEYQNIPRDTNKSLQYQPQIENGANPDIFERNKENVGIPRVNNENQYQFVHQKANEYDSNGYQSMPIQIHNGRPTNIPPNSDINHYRTQFQHPFYQLNNAHTNSQINLSQQKDIPIIFLHTHGKLGLPFLPSTPLVKFPIEQDKRYGYEDIPIQNITNINQQASSNINAAAERRNINIAERRNYVTPNKFRGFDNTQSIIPQQPLLNNLYSDGRRNTIWQAGDPTADYEPEILVRQINETCAYFRFNETTEGTEDGTKNNIWNAGDYSAQREEEELIRSVNVTCQNFTIDVLSNFTGLYSLAEYCSQCLVPNNDNTNEYNSEDMQSPDNKFVEQFEYTNFAPQKSNYANLELKQNGYYNSVYQPNGYPYSGPQQNSYHSSEPQQNGYHASISKQNSYPNIVLVNYQQVSSPIPLIPYPFGSYSNGQEISDYQHQPVRREV